MKNLSILFISLMFIYACTNTGEKGGEKAKAPLENEIQKHGKPSDKDIILMIMQNGDIPLTVDSSCLGVGSDTSDKTIGQFLSSFWQHHTNSAGMNSLTINVTDGNDNEIKEKHWKATFMINGQTENENWSWGVSFYIIDKNWVVVKKSFKCLGAG